MTLAEGIFIMGFGGRGLLDQSLFFFHLPFMKTSEVPHSELEKESTKPSVRSLGELGRRESGRTLQPGGGKGWNSSSGSLYMCV